MRKLLFFLLLCPLYLQAQDSLFVRENSNSAILKFNHLSLLDPLSSIQFALEYRLGKKISLQHEAGYITRILYNEGSVKNRRGLRLRNEVRFYLQQKGSRMEGLYLTPEFLFIYQEYTRRSSFGMGCEDSFDCDYYQWMNYDVQKQVYAIHPKVGFQSIYRRLVADFYAGIGFRHVRVRNINKPPNAFDDEFFSGPKREGNYDLPSLSLGFKIGFVL